MAISTYVGHFQIDTTKTVGQTQAITGVGFQPKAVIFFATGETGSTDTVLNADAIRGFGFATSDTSRYCVSSSSQNAQATQNGNRSQSNTECLMLMNATGTVDGAHDLTSFDSDGFTLDVTDQYSIAGRVMFIAFGGTDITNQTVNSFQRPNTSGNQSYTTAGFQPDIVFFISTKQGTVNKSVSADDHLTFGVMTSTDQYVWVGGGNDGAATMQTISYCRSGEVLGFFNSAISDIIGRASYVSMDTNGFTLNWLEDTDTTAHYIGYMAIKGGNWKLGDFLSNTDTTTDIVESGFGFQPNGVITVSHMQGASTQDTVQDHNALSIGAFTGTSNRLAFAWRDPDALADSDITVAMEFDETGISVTDATIEALVDVKSIDSGGFTMIMDTADSSQKFFWYVATGNASSGTNLTVNDAYCTSQADAVTLVKQSTLIIQDSNSTSQLDTFNLTKQSAIVILDSFCTSQVDEVILSSTGFINLYPSFDVVDGNWTNQDGNNTNLYDSLNEESVSDADYIWSEYSPSGSFVVLKLNSAVDPNSSSNHVLSYRYSKFPSGGQAVNLTVQLRQGYVDEGNQGTLIAEWTHTNISDTLATVDQTLTGLQADSITDYSSLYIRIVAGV